MTTRDIIQVTRQMVTEYMAKFDSSHDMYHVERVVALALDIAKDCSTKDQTVDLQVVELAALCHDVGDRKYYQGKETGGQLIEKFLQEHGYEKASLVSKIVDHIGFSKELGWDDQKDPKEQVKWRNSCLELHAVQDADKLDAIGAFGIMRCAAFSGTKNIPLFVPDQKIVKDLTQEIYLQNKNQSSIAHFHEKLFKLKTMMRTRKGKALAIKRDEFMKTFVDQINEEYNLLK
ncbi:hypothetical protein G6F46_003021 [Rhizopus delemar]|uniref:HD/PDEase domain-containing protein n=2 Tax=Rhizopus TaxID=4842 RepID=A0A9P6Z5T9_9FUNG|nr:hypothetical protein G6F55_002292 [Rhizopus delemar]KAG1550216.1 hypothetical protein G6F51_002580 [Rhizopus arrhizus]KAG1498923.1 hypothetical protein G6F54_004745 [Rhizopus delemar]KAG1515890.1 hypothetical protein G6F53_002577 [Rhizopus delemar]KAG1527354.1 hypothetical protein G6F52_001611 [Rhizopus delemar]